MLKVYIDGACEPTNPGGTASYGMVVYRDGKQVFAKGKVIGSGAAMSNNVAEYAGLLEFLRLWQGIEEATVYSDSQLLIKQMSGEWNAHSGLYLESYQAAKLKCEGKPISFIWIARELNTIADSLSLKALEIVGIKPRIRA